MMHIRMLRRGVILLLMALCLSGVGAAEQNVEPVEVLADEMEYNRATGWIEGRGNAIVKRSGHVLRANMIKVNTETDDVYAEGNVTLQRGESVWQGENLHYNFRTKTGDAASLTFRAEPFRLIGSERAERIAENVYVIHRAHITTCNKEPGHTHFKVTARKLEMSPDNYIKTRGGVWRFGRVPVMYIPYWHRNLHDDFGFRFYPGHSSRMGTFLLSSYRYRINEVLRGETHLDYRSERGVAVGQDLKWGRGYDWMGNAKLYYADDQKPVADDEDAATSDIDNERYRFSLKHSAYLSPRDYMLLQAYLLSDEDLLEDFFEDEYRVNSQPDNYLTYTHRGDGYSANTILRGRLNDFYTKINRMPELSLDVTRKQIADSFFYYEGDAALANLEKVWEEDSTSSDYSSLRFDTAHLVHRPSKHFGFLNIIPRLGMRGTYYSETKTTESTVEVTETVTTNTVTLTDGTTSSEVTTSTETNSIAEITDAGADLRTSIELGVEFSFKAFKTFGDETTNPRRHIVEPYANYTLIPEPSLLADNLYQFDRVDRLSEQHYLKVGTRNKWQMKRNNSPFDIIDVDIYTLLDFVTDNEVDTLEDLYLDAEFRPAVYMAIDLDAIYDVSDSTLQEFNGRTTFAPFTDWKASAEYRFREDDSSLLRGEATFKPNTSWGFNAYGRYEFEESRFEEYGGYVQRSLDCMVIRTGVGILPGYTRSDGTERDDEYRVLLEFWLTAFPEVAIAGRHKQ